MGSCFDGGLDWSSMAVTSCVVEEGTAEGVGGVGNACDCWIVSPRMFVWSREMVGFVTLGPDIGFINRIEAEDCLVW